MEDLSEKGPNYEQAKWEEEHLHDALWEFGARDAKKKHKKKQDNYEYVLDDEIEFVQALQMPGTKDKKKDVKNSFTTSITVHVYSIIV